ncbi:MAG: GNAT family N-acetyltransferase [Trueperaceae bacterium]
MRSEPEVASGVLFHLVGNRREILVDVSEVRDNVVVRRAEPFDAAALVTLQRQIYREERWFVGDGPPSEASLAQRLRAVDPKSSLWLVAGDQRQLWGWLELHRLAPARLRHVATLTLAVSPTRRRRGVGSALLEGGYSWARGVGVRKISLNVRAGNVGAIGLYQEEGFVLEGRERDQIRTREGYEDNLIMAKFID